MQFSPAGVSVKSREATNMKPRERVIAALNHEEPDRCPSRTSPPEAA